MLEIFLVFLIFAGILKVIDKPNVDKLKCCTSVNEAVRLRQSIRDNRKIAFIIYVTIYIILCLIINIITFDSSDAQNTSSTIRGLVLTPFFMYIYLRKHKAYTKIMGVISTYTKDEFLSNHDKYALYLRGFEHDKYDNDLKISDNEFCGFREFEFTSVLQQEIPACAVGMTKEVNSPLGAVRIYLEDKDWKDGVKELMQKAHNIFILVDDRDSCIWEIEQSVTLLEKTTFIIDDINKYNRVRSRLANKINFPELTSLSLNNEIIVLKFNNFVFEVTHYNNSILGYSQLLHIQYHEIEKIKKQKKRRRLLWIIYGILFGPLFLFSIIAFVIGYFGEEKNETPKYNLIEQKGNVDVDALVKEGKRLCPLRIDSTTTLIDVRNEYPYLSYYYIIDENHILLCELAEFEDFMKKQALNSVTDLLKTILSKQNYGLKYHYKGNVSAEEFTILIESDEINQSTLELPDSVVEEVKKNLFKYTS